MPWQWLADAVLLLHFGVVLFVVGGLLLVLVGNRLHWPWVNGLGFRLAHLAAIAVVVMQAWLGQACPLTTLESWLRTQAGSPSYEGSFVEHWVQRPTILSPRCGLPHRWPSSFIGAAKFNTIAVTLPDCRMILASVARSSSVGRCNGTRPVSMSASARTLALLLDRSRRQARRHHAGPDRHLPAAEDRSVHYLVDVLPRVDERPASRAEELTPRRWKTLFAGNPPRSTIHQFPNDGRGPTPPALWIHRQSAFVFGHEATTAIRLPRLPSPRQTSRIARDRARCRAMYPARRGETDGCVRPASTEVRRTSFPPADEARS